MRKAKDAIADIRYVDLEAYYFFRLMNVAMAQFDYENLPDTIDRRYMEKVLLTRGSVAVYQPQDSDFYVATGYMPWDGKTKPTQDAVTWYNDLDRDISNENYQEKLFRGNASVYDIYGNPTRIMGVGFNGEQIYPSEKWGVCWDNMTREPLVVHIRRYAQMLAETHMTFRMNLRMQNKPYLLLSNRNKELSFKKFFRALFNFEPVVELGQQFVLDEDVKVLDMKVDYHGTEFLENLKEIWNQALDMLGIATQNTKKERLITGEIGMDRQSDLITMNSRLLNRVEFWDKYNNDNGTDVIVKMSSASVAFEDVFGDDFKLNEQPQPKDDETGVDNG